MAPGSMIVFHAWFTSLPFLPLLPSLAPPAESNRVSYDGCRIDVLDRGSPIRRDPKRDLNDLFPDWQTLSRR